MRTIILLAAGTLAFAQNQKTFPTPEAAAQDLIQAASAGNTGELQAIFGANAKTVLTCGDPAQDKTERAEFANAAQEKFELERDSMDHDRMILSVGKDDWPFPVPIVKRNGSWIFDTAMGEQSIKARRIGANEIDAIAICESLADAEIRFSEANPRHSYAPNLAALASYVPKDFIDQEGAAAPKAYRGYYFKILDSQGANAPGGAHAYLVKNHMMGGFAVVAWPAQYGVSGIHTFVVNHDGIVYEKDLGPHARVTSFNPDTTWRSVN